MDSTVLDRDHASSRPPAVAGMFYPDDPYELTCDLDRMLEASGPPAVRQPVALIAPHAGYVYSGLVAAQAYAGLRGWDIRRVVVISPSHYESFPGVSFYPGRSYRTPLGTIPVAAELRDRLVHGRSYLKLADSGHQVLSGMRNEHALEVQLPFLQRVLPDFQLVPAVVGSQDFQAVRELAAALAEEADAATLVVASSDLSHYRPDSEARRLDAWVVDAVRRCDHFGLRHYLETGMCEACGSGPMLAAMMFAQLRGAEAVEVRSYATSGDVPPYRKDGVVGYLSALFMPSDRAQEPGPDLAEAQRRELFWIARQAISRALQGENWEPPAGEDGLNLKSAVFVTLRRHGDLRGCIGSIVARASLREAVSQSAVNAALNDHRFKPLQERELPDIGIEISILSPFRLLARPDDLVPGRHGLLVEQGRYRGLLLPQVATEHRWNRQAFLEHTCRKAGLDPDAWKSPDTALYTFTAEILEEAAGGPTPHTPDSV